MELGKIELEDRVERWSWKKIVENVSSCVI
jgi:hypothetical protein